MEKAKSTRVGYKKSRNGCVRCKQRRVKCNEEVPCSACVRHRVPCSLESHDPGYSARPGTTPLIDPALRPPSNSLSNSPYSTNTPSGPSPLSFFSSSSLANPLDEPDCWISNAELMLHYTTVAYRTLVYSENVATTFQYDVPREALSYPYFLRMILAFSGYHLAYLHPEKRPFYLLLASKHESQAIRGIREALSNSVNSTNCHALYATTLFIVVSKFAAFPSCEDHRVHGCASPIQALIEIFSLVNGIDAIIHSEEGGNIRRGPLKELFGQASQPHIPGNLLQGLSESLPELRRRTASEVLDSKTQIILTSAVDTLKNCIDFVSSRLNVASQPELRALFWWPMLVSRHFLDLAGSAHPLALAILAHYDVLLYWAEPRYWVFEDWPQSLMDAIVEKVRGSSWEDLISWPLRVVRGE